MSISEIKKAASNKGQVTIRAIAYRAKKINKDFGPFSDEVAYGVVAQQTGVEVSRFISETQLLDEIRIQMDRIAEKALDRPRPKTKTIYKTKVVNIGKDIELNEHI